MISSILVMLNMASAFGLEAPEIIRYHQSTEACLVEASKLNAKHSLELQKAKAGFVCLVVTVPTI